MSSTLFRLVSMSVAIALAGLLPGCREDADTPRYRELEGRVSGITPSSGEVEMMWYNPKSKMEIPLAGKLAPDAEILIDGATARLEDIRIDDLVVVTGREERRDDQRQWVATKVRVVRNQ